MECSHHFPLFGHFGQVLGLFWVKKGLFLALNCRFWNVGGTTRDNRSRPPPLSFWLKLCVTILHTHRYHPPKFLSSPKHHNAVAIFAHFVHAHCLLLAACCLLAVAKLGRSTLDTKEGYEAKTGSTSSVTVALRLLR